MLIIERCARKERFIHPLVQALESAGCSVFAIIPTSRANEMTAKRELAWLVYAKAEDQASEILADTMFSQYLDALPS
jgi:hypothetical protein